MLTNPIEIDLKLRELIKRHTNVLQVRKDDSSGLEVSGTIPTMQGKQKVDGIYFASVIPKPKDCRLYFFPIYTDVEEFTDIDTALRNCLKGKSCFHIKKMEASLEVSISAMIDKGIEVYQEKGLL